MDDSSHHSRRAPEETGAVFAALWPWAHQQVVRPLVVESVRANLPGVVARRPRASTEKLRTDTPTPPLFFLFSQPFVAEKGHKKRVRLVLCPESAVRPHAIAGLPRPRRFRRCFPPRNRRATRSLDSTCAARPPPEVSERERSGPQIKKHLRWQPGLLLVVHVTREQRMHSVHAQPRERLLSHEARKGSHTCNNNQGRDRAMLFL